MKTRDINKERLQADVDAGFKDNAPARELTDREKRFYAKMEKRGIVFPAHIKKKMS